MPFVFLRGDVGIVPYITFGKLFCEVRTPKERPYRMSPQTFTDLRAADAPPQKLQKILLKYCIPILNMV